MKNRGGIVFFAILVLAFGLVYVLSRSSNPEEAKADNGVILFVSQTCGHCAAVKKWLSENEAIRQQSGVVEKDLSNSLYQKEIALKAEECELDTSQGIFVPFLYDKGECFVGEDEVIDHLRGEYSL